MPGFLQGTQGIHPTPGKKKTAKGGTSIRKTTETDTKSLQRSVKHPQSIPNLSLDSSFRPHFEMSTQADVNPLPNLNCPFDIIDGYERFGVDQTTSNDIGASSTNTDIGLSMTLIDPGKGPTDMPWPLFELDWNRLAQDCMLQNPAILLGVDRYMARSTKSSAHDVGNPCVSVPFYGTSQGYQLPDKQDICDMYGPDAASREATDSMLLSDSHESIAQLHNHRYFDNDGADRSVILCDWSAPHPEQSSMNLDGSDFADAASQKSILTENIPLLSLHSSQPDVQLLVPPLASSVQPLYSLDQSSLTPSYSYNDTANIFNGHHTGTPSAADGVDYSKGTDRFT